MAYLRVQRRRGRRGDGGASLVEFALISPLLFMLLLGTLTGGLTLSRHNSVKNAAREATRFGAILPDFTAPTSLDALYAQVVDAATGDLDPDVPGRYICVALIDYDTVAKVDKWTYKSYLQADSPSDSGTGQLLSAVPGACKEGHNAAVGATTRRVWVRVSRESEIQALLFSQTIDLESRSMARYER